MHLESKLKKCLFVILLLVVIYLAGQILISKHYERNFKDFSEKSKKINPLGEFSLVRDNIWF